MIYFSSDFHFGHRVIVPKYRDFPTTGAHDSMILDQIAALGKRDILYVLGDFLFDCPDYEMYVHHLSKMSCRIKLVLGNHDTRKLYKETRLPKLELQLPLHSYKNHWVSHAPIHPQEMRGRNGNIHGHLHSDTVTYEQPVYENGKEVTRTMKDTRYFNVNIEDNNYKFVPFDLIRTVLETNAKDSNGSNM